ncbi:hypothetical protein [Erythrobacter sp. YT30]|nr:hypothetical protein [Erythrobacter sp. YT30]
MCTKSVLPSAGQWTVRFGQNAIVQNFADPVTYGVRFGARY